MVVGERTEASIVAIQKINGEYGEQYQIDLQLTNGFKTRDWIKYYSQPSIGSRLGQLCTTIWSTLHKINSPEEAMTTLKEYGTVYLECKGHRIHEGKTFPKLKVITTFLPISQSSLNQDV